MSKRALSTRKTAKKMRRTRFPNNKTHHSDKGDEKNRQNNGMESDCVHYSGRLGRLL